nr:AAA family ATPase [Clostridia bacterium]
MITTVQWLNHPIIGNLSLDFRKANGEPYNAIVLAGENGTGKTTILDTLCTFLNRGSFSPFDHLQYRINGVDYTITRGDHPEFGFHIRKNENEGIEKKISSNKNNNANTIDSDTEDIRHYGCSYSKARSGFKTEKVTNITNQQLDDTRYEDDAKDDFTSIKRLLIDIDTQDNSQWMDETRKGSGLSFEAFRLISKKYRFEQAFNNFFEKMIFKRIDNTQADEKKILFEKGGTEITIDSLSTGEKQIVFRGAHLLKNSKSITGEVVLIDEPELSLHPKWQMKILQYYRALFTNAGVQETQMIFATHSEYVLRAALENSTDVLVVVLKEDNGAIVAQKITAPFALPTVTFAETNYLAFDVVSKDYHIELYGYLQNKTGNLTVKNCDNYIAAHSDYDATKHNKPYIHGSTTYQTLPTYIRNAIDHPDAHYTYTENELRLSIELLVKLCK